MNPDIKPPSPPVSRVDFIARWRCETLHVVIACADEDGRNNVDRIVEAAVNAADLAAVMAEDHA